MDHSVDKELARRSHSRSADQRLDVEVMSGMPQGSLLDQCCLTSLLLTWTVGLSAPSASLPMTPIHVVQSTHWKEGMPSRKTLTGLRGGLV